MKLEFGVTTELFNTQYAPLAVLLAYYRQENTLQPLQKVEVQMKTRQYSPIDKLEQVLVSILAGCETVSEVNTTIRPDRFLAQAGGWVRVAEQSTLSETLDALTLMNIEQLDGAVRAIWQRHSATLQRDWRAFLWLDFDLSGLPSGKQAEGSLKGYFSGKKTLVDAKWPALVPSVITKRCGRSSIRATKQRSLVSRMRCWVRKLH